MTTPTGGRLVPANGKRSLSLADASRRDEAMRCIREKSSRCQGKIHVNIFFDGTGNNRDWNGTFVSGKTRSTQTQRARNGHSNVARLEEISFREVDNGLFTYYVPGVGTPFHEVGDTSEDGSMLGGAAALYGAERISWAILQIYNAAHRYLMNDALLIPPHLSETIVKNMSSQIRQVGFEGPMRRKILRNWENKLRQVIEKHQRKLLEINVSVFGFSRGAATARAFVHRMFEVVNADEGGCERKLAGVPLRLKFMGIFDTVASVGLAAMSRVTDGKMSWADGQMMSIHPDIEKCVHFVALHEQRINFPVDLASGPRVTQVLYPGMHSDVGGGYGPGSQGKAMQNWGMSPQLSQIPLIDMHYEALVAGIPLMTINEIDNDANIKPTFACDSRLINAYNNWLTGHGIPGGEHRQQIKKHTEQYVLWQGMRLNKDSTEWQCYQPYYQRTDSEDKYDLDNARKWFSTRRYEKMLSALDWAFGDRELYEIANRGYSLEARPPLMSAALFDDYVHDSLAGFYMWIFTELSMPGLRTDGYMRYRTVFDIRSTQQQTCAPAPPPVYGPAVVPSIGQVFNDLGAAMR